MVFTEESPVVTETEGRPCGPPPGLSIPASSAEQVKQDNSKDSVAQVCKDMIKHTDEVLTDKVEKMLYSAAGMLQTSFDRQQEQVNSNMEQELHSCREKVKSLEADKEQMQKTVQMLQEQFANLTNHFYGMGQMPMGGQMPMVGQMPGPPMQMGGVGAHGGMMGPFATCPSGLPMIPPLPLMQHPAMEISSQPSTTAPASPVFAPSTPPSLPGSMPPTPNRAPCGPPATAPPPPPPGLSELLGAPAAPAPGFASPSVGFFPPPPGLSEVSFEALPKPSAAISLSSALETMKEEEKPKPVLQEKARLSPEEAHRQALKFMQDCQKESDASDTLPPTSPARFMSPGARGTPSRSIGLGLSSPYSSGLNLTPKRSTPRMSHGKLTPGMRSPMIPASPFVICESGGSVFGFTIRKADDCSLGLDVNHTDGGNFLQVTGVKPGGAMQAWNKQCVGGPAAGKAVLPGDRIVKVNDATMPKEMLQQCREQKLLRFTVQRGEVDEDFDLSQATDSRAATKE